MYVDNYISGATENFILSFAISITLSFYELNILNASLWLSILAGCPYDVCTTRKKPIEFHFRNGKISDKRSSD